MAENVVQPEASSAPETVVNAAPEAQAKEAERSPYIPRERFDEVNERRRVAEERARQMEELVYSVLAEQPATGGRTEPSAAGQASSYEPDDPYKRIEPEIRSLKQTVFELHDRADREAFWRENDHVAEDIRGEVETLLGTFRRQGVTGIRREDVLAHSIGRRQLPELKKKAKAPAQATPPVNSVAYTEGGPSAGKLSKPIDKMTKEEIEKLPSEVLYDYLKGKTF